MLIQIDLTSKEGSSQEVISTNVVPKRDKSARSLTPTGHEKLATYLPCAVVRRSCLVPVIMGYSFRYESFVSS